LQDKAIKIAIDKPSESQSASIEQLTAKVSELQLELENRIPSLHLDVWEVLIVPHLNSAEVFVDASVANDTPNTQATVRQFKLTLEAAGNKLDAQRNRADLEDYRLIDRYEIRTGLIEPFRFTLLTDLSGSMNEKNPILHGVPHRGWLHFSFPDASDWPTSTNNVLYFVRAPLTNRLNNGARTTFWGSWVEQGEIGVSIDAVESAIVSVDGYVGSGMTFLASVNKTGDRMIIKV
jgi:hypothetical protein